VPRQDVPHSLPFQPLLGLALQPPTEQSAPLARNDDQSGRVEGSAETHHIDASVSLLYSYRFLAMLRRGKEVREWKFIFIEASRKAKIGIETLKRACEERVKEDGCSINSEVIWVLRQYIKQREKEKHTPQQDAYQHKVTTPKV
jgi:hypothetical protein